MAKDAMQISTHPLNSGPEVVKFEPAHDNSIKGGVAEDRGQVEGRASKPGQQVMNPDQKIKQAARAQASGTGKDIEAGA